MIFIELIKIVANIHSVRGGVLCARLENQYGSGTHICPFRMTSKQGLWNSVESAADIPV